MCRALCLLFLLAGCAGGERVLYVGTVQPASGTCDPPSRATLAVRNKAVQFAPTSGVIVLPGSVGQDGTIQARLGLNDANKRPYSLVLTARRSGNHLDGDYTTQRCRYAVRMTAVED